MPPSRLVQQRPRGAPRRHDHLRLPQYKKRHQQQRSEDQRAKRAPGLHPCQYDSGGRGSGSGVLGRPHILEALQETLAAAIQFLRRTVRSEQRTGVSWATCHSQARCISTSAQPSFRSASHVEAVVPPADKQALGVCPSGTQS